MCVGGSESWERPAITISPHSGQWYCPIGAPASNRGSCGQPRTVCGWAVDSTLAGSSFISGIVRLEKIPIYDVDPTPKKKTAKTSRIKPIPIMCDGDDGIIGTGVSLNSMFSHKGKGQGTSSADGQSWHGSGRGSRSTANRARGSQWSKGSFKVKNSMVHQEPYRGRTMKEISDSVRDNVRTMETPCSKIFG